MTNISYVVTELHLMLELDSCDCCSLLVRAVPRYNLRGFVNEQKDVYILTCTALGPVRCRISILNGNLPDKLLFR